MPESRFPDARDVFEAFPIACEDIETQPNDQSSLVFLRELVKGPKPEDAVPFCAYLLPRREAVWWASQCVRMLLADLTERDNAALRAAEEWVREPEELNRQRAHQIGTMANQRAASTWVALAAGWSGGLTIVGEYTKPLVPSHMTARAAFTAVRLALGGKPDRTAHISQCAELAIKFAQEP